MLYFSIYFWIVILFFTLSYVYLQVKRKRLYELASKFNGPPTIPILGNALKCIIAPEDVVKVTLEGIKYYKSPTRFWLGPHLAVHIWDPKQLEIILTSQHLLRKEPLIYDFGKTVVGDGLISLPVQQWKRHRRVIAPAFSQKNLHATFDIFRKHSKRLVVELQSKEGKGVFDVEKVLSMRIIEILLESILCFDSSSSSLNNTHLAEWLDEGIETTSSAIGYALIALGIYPEIQQKLYDEIMEVIGPTKDIEYEDLKRLEYLDRVVKENLRMFSAGVGIARRSDQEIQLDEYTIPAGCTILMSLVGVHRDPNIWPNPSKFDPDRFLPEEVAKRHPYSWISFSAGPRNCVGLRFALLTIKTFLVDLVRTYEVSTTYATIDEIDFTCLFVLKPTKGFNISLTFRGQC